MPLATSVCGLMLLVDEALSYWCGSTGSARHVRRFYQCYRWLTCCTGAMLVPVDVLLYSYKSTNTDAQLTGTARAAPSAMLPYAAADAAPQDMVKQ